MHAVYQLGVWSTTILGLDDLDEAYLFWMFTLEYSKAERRT